MLCEVMRVSVLMPCHNAQSYVAEAIDSVLAQDHRDVELVIVDDGSSDKSLDVISQYKSENLLVIQTDNRGASAARNRALDASSGGYVIFMDADDIISPSHVSALLSLSSGPHDIVMGQWDRFCDKIDEAKFPWRPTYRDALGPDWLIGGGWGMMQSAMFLLPRVHVDRFGGWNEALSLIDDFEFYCRMIANCSSLRFASGAKVFYRSGIPNSLSSQRSRVYAEGALVSLLDGTNSVLSVLNTELARSACANVFQHFEYEFYPSYPDLRAFARARVAKLGGSQLRPDGPPYFQIIRHLAGWRVARRIQRFAEAKRLNLAALNGALRRTPSV